MQNYVVLALILTINYFEISLTCRFFANFYFTCNCIDQSLILFLMKFGGRFAVTILLYNRPQRCQISLFIEIFDKAFFKDAAYDYERVKQSAFYAKKAPRALGGPFLLDAPIYVAFHVSSPRAAREREIMLFSAFV